MDWLIKRQPAIERKLAKRHLEQGAIAFYAVSSSYLTGSRCELAARGYSRDHRSDRPQIVYGLLCNHAGCPIAVDAFPGNTGDPTTLATQVDKLRKRFKLSHVVLVSDRGMITQARIHEDPKPLGLDWITRLAPLHNPQARRQQNNTAGLVRFARNSQCHHARSPR